MNRQDKTFLKYFFVFFGLAAITMIGALIAIDDTSEYQDLTEKTAMSSRVTNVGERAAHIIRYVDFESGEKIAIHSGTRNFEFDPTDLIYFLTASDFVEKKAGNDTIYITRSNLSITNTKRYLFVLNKELNMELDSGQIF